MLERTATKDCLARSNQQVVILETSRDTRDYSGGKSDPADRYHEATRNT